MDRLDQPTRALVHLAARIAEGSEPAIERAVDRALAAAVPSAWVDELLLQSVLICGWPRALTAARLWRQRVAHITEGEDATDYSQHGVWRSRGEATCRAVYGETYEALRRNIRSLHPALDAGMIVEGYGRILGRPALDLCRRELCTVAQIAVQGAPAAAAVPSAGRAQRGRAGFGGRRGAGAGPAAARGGDVAGNPTAVGAG